MPKSKKPDFNKAQGADISKPHMVSQTFTEAMWYPPHPPRKSSGIYVKTHKLLIFEKDTPCWICGIKHSQITDSNKGKKTKTNPFGAKDLETHHNVIEWAAANAIDWDKVREDYPDLKSLEHVAHAFDVEHGKGDPQDLKKKKYSKIDPTEFVDGVEQMRVLCDVHHRAPMLGTHSSVGPNWLLQRYQDEGFQFKPANLSEEVKDKYKQTKEVQKKYAKGNG